MIEHPDIACAAGPWRRDMENAPKHRRCLWYVRNKHREWISYGSASEAGLYLQGFSALAFAEVNDPPDPVKDIANA